MAQRSSTRRTSRASRGNALGTPSDPPARLRHAVRRTLPQMRKLHKLRLPHLWNAVQMEACRRRGCGRAPGAVRRGGSAAQWGRLQPPAPASRNPENMFALRTVRARIATMSYSPAAIALGTMVNCGCCRLLPGMRKVGVFLALSVTSDASRTPIHFRQSRHGIR
jgi:hypothetical protein